MAVKCLGELLTGVSHFNCMHEVLESLVHSACGGDARCRAFACAALEALLRGKQRTDVMVAAVQLAVDAVRNAKCTCPPDVVHALMAVRFKDLSKSDVEKGELLATPPHPAVRVASAVHVSCVSGHMCLHPPLLISPRRAGGGGLE